MITPVKKPSDAVSNFLSEIIHQIETHKLQHETQTLDDEFEKLYNSISSGDMELLLTMNKNAASDHFRKKMLLDYIKGLFHFDFLPQALAIDSKGDSVLVWAQVNNEEQEYDLYRLEGRINKDYSEKGYKIDTTIVETDDNIPIPVHYQLIPLKVT